MKKIIIALAITAGLAVPATTMPTWNSQVTAPEAAAVCTEATPVFDSIYPDRYPGMVGEMSVESRYIVSPAKINVALPEGYDATDTSKRYPVVYLLNGHGGNNRTWSTILPLDSLATAYETIIVCPDGRNSWYWDSPIDPKMQMESYVVNELVPFVDSMFNTRAERSQRAITGLSMGGHGGLWLGLRHPELFGNCGSTSGGVDIRPFPTKWNMADRLGNRDANPKRWDEHTVMTLVPKIKKGEFNIIFDCGTEDFFIKVNNNLHRELNRRGIKHTYLTSPGIHNAKYWSKSILPQMDFFSTKFKEAATR